MKGVSEEHIRCDRQRMPEEIASAVLWLSSPGAAFITGQDIIVDGGYTAQ